MTDTEKEFEAQACLLAKTTLCTTAQFIEAFILLTRTGASLESGHEPEQINGGIYND